MGLGISASVGACVSFVPKFFCVDNRLTIRRMSVGFQRSDDLLTSLEKSTLMEAMDAIKKPEHRPADQGGSGNSTKFLSRELVTGVVHEAAEGLAAFLCINEASVREMHNNPEKAIEREILALNDPEVSALYEYIVHEECKEVQKPQGMQDEGRAGKNLQYFVCNS